LKVSLLHFQRNAYISLHLLAFSKAN